MKFRRYSSTTNYSFDYACVHTVGVGFVDLLGKSVDFLVERVRGITVLVREADARQIASESGDGNARNFLHQAKITSVGTNGLFATWGAHAGHVIQICMVDTMDDSAYEHGLCVNGGEIET